MSSFCRSKNAVNARKVRLRDKRSGRSRRSNLTAKTQGWNWKQCLFLFCVLCVCCVYCVSFIACVASNAHAVALQLVCRGCYKLLKMAG